MHTLKFMFPLFIGLILLSAIAMVNLNLPPTVQAAPLAGFTPDPGDDGGDGDGGDGDVASDPSTPDEGRAPADYVLVRLDQCDMTCSANANASTYEPLAYRLDGQPLPPLLIPMAEADAAFEIIAPVRMVHDGSGFIAVGDLSTQRDTRISVPYPGKWEVFLTGEPHFMTAAAVDISETNMAQVTAALSEGPVSMGIVEANTTTAQLVKCPIACVIDSPAPTTTAPPALPETGGVPAETVFLTTIIILIGLILTFVGLNVYVAE